MCVLSLAGRFAPSQLPKNQVSLVYSWYRTTTVVSRGGVTLYCLCILNRINSADTYDMSQNAKSHKRPLWYSQYMSIRVNSQPNASEHTNAFFLSENRLGTSSQSGPSWNDTSCNISSGSSLFAKLHIQMWKMVWDKKHKSIVPYSTRLRVCAGSSDHSLLADLIRTTS